MSSLSEHSSQDDQSSQESDIESGGNNLDEQLSKVARASVVGKLTVSDLSGGQAILLAMGGLQGLVETIVPGFVFLGLFTLTANVPLSVGVSLASALVFAVIRLMTKKPLTQVLAGAFGTILSAALALMTGRGEDNFLFGIFVNALYAASLLLSIVVRYPLVGVIAGYASGTSRTWRDQTKVRRAMVAMTWVWFALFALRLAVQLPLYLAHTPETTSMLALMKLLMGIPLFAPLLLVTWFVVRSQFFQQDKEANV